MKTITKTVNVYSFDELSEEAKQVAIEYERNYRYRNNDFAEWAIDNCYLLEPPHKELTNLFGDNFYEVLNTNNKYKDTPLIKNNRKVYFSLDRNRYIDISNAIEIQNDYYFLKWLGIEEKDFKDNEGYFMLEFDILKNTIEFDTNDFYIEFSGEQDKILKKATEKFEEYCEDILKHIEQDIEYNYSDEAIINQFDTDETQFTENGDLYFH